MGLDKRDKQRAGLRIVVRHPRGGLAFAWFATVKGLNIYAGQRDTGDREALRLTYHKDGNTWFHSGGNLLTRMEKRPPLGEITGLEEICSWSLSKVVTGYTPDPESDTRKTLIFDYKDTRPHLVDLWIAGPGAGDKYLETILSQPRYSYESMDIVGTLVSDWTSPRLAVVLQAIGDEAWGKRPPGVDEPDGLYSATIGDTMFTLVPQDKLVRVDQMTELFTRREDRL